jgi:acyl carrier protein
LEQIPLTANSKIDRRALPIPEIKTAGRYAAPRDNMEEKLVGIWSGVLGTSFAIGIDDNFFELGGHSLKATIMISKIHKEFNVRIPLAEIFKTASIRNLSRYMKKTAECRYISIEKAEKKEYYRLSSAQKRLYIMEDIGDLGTTYNLPKVMTIEGELEESRFRAAIIALPHIHDSLRTSFHIIEEELVQRIQDKTKFEIEYYDLYRTQVEEEEQTTEDRPGTHLSSVIRHLSSEFIRPFNLSQAPLFRVGLVKIEKAQRILMVDMHHIISDGVSMGILIQDFLHLYQTGKALKCHIQYKDFVEWQNRLFESGEIKKQEKYWLDRMKGEIPVLAVPTDYSRPDTQKFEGDRITFYINEELTGKIKGILTHSNTTLFIGLLAVFDILLSKYSGQEDIIVGMPIAGRNHADTQRVIGLFVNTLAIRNFPNGEKPFGEFLQEVKINALEAHENQDYPLEELVDKINIPRDASRNPLFDVLLVSENLDQPELLMEEVKFSSYEFTNRIAHLDLVLLIIERNDTILMTFEYATTLFKSTTMENMAQRYIEILEQVVVNQDIKLKDIEISSKLKDVKLNKGYEDFVDFDF